MKEDTVSESEAHAERSASLTAANWALCPSTHCERAEECRSPSDCCVRTKGRKALLPAFHAYLEAEYGGKLPELAWDERYGGLPYHSSIAARFRDFMAGVDAAGALAVAREHSSPLPTESESSRDAIKVSAQ